MRPRLLSWGPGSFFFFSNAQTCLTASCERWFWDTVHDGKGNLISNWQPHLQSQVNLVQWDIKSDCYQLIPEKKKKKKRERIGGRGRGRRGHTLMKSYTERGRPVTAAGSEHLFSLTAPIKTRVPLLTCMNRLDPILHLTPPQVSMSLSQQLK